MSTKRIIVIVVAVVSLLALFFIISSKLKANKGILNEKAELSQQVNDAIPVTADEVKERTFTNSFGTDGSFNPVQKVAVISDAQGKVTKLNFDDGTVVSKGTVLASLDNTLLRNQAESIKLNIEKSKKDLERFQTLLASGGATGSQIDDLKNGIAQYEIQLSSVNKQISDTYLKAPISGTIVNKKIEHGVYVSPGTNIAEIINIGSLDFQTYLTESQVFKIKKGQDIRMSTDVYPGKDFFGKVKFIDVSSSASKTYLVEIGIANSSSHPLKGGLTGKAYFENGGKLEGLSIPRTAVIGSFADANVYVVKDSIVHLIPVSIGSFEGEDVQVTSGLSKGDKVVTSGQINLKEGSKIVVANKPVAGN